MASDTVVRARINGQVKKKAAKVLADMGLSVSDAIRLQSDVFGERRARLWKSCATAPTSYCITNGWMCVESST